MDIVVGNGHDDTSSNPLHEIVGISYRIYTLSFRTL